MYSIQVTVHRSRLVESIEYVECNNDNINFCRINIFVCLEYSPNCNDLNEHCKRFLYINYLILLGLI